MNKNSILDNNEEPDLNHKEENNVKPDEPETPVG
jgi:hypothetical protein